MFPYLLLLSGILVRMADKNKPDNVVEMGKEDFFDLKTYPPTLNWDRDENNEKIYLRFVKTE